MRPIYLLASIAAVAAIAVPAAANLTVGAKAPMFVGKGAVAGKPITFTLATQLKKGPVVVYFFPAAFTGGCNAEAHAFAEAVPDFQKAGATVVGLTAAAKGDNGVAALSESNIEPLLRFSSEYCAGKFPVVFASAQTVAGFDVRLGATGTMTNRTSYVIAPDGKIIFVHSDMSADKHVSSTLAAVKEWRKAHPKGR